MPPLLPNVGPPVANTHEPIPESDLRTLCSALEEASTKQPDGRLSAKVINEVATNNNQPRAYAWAAMAQNPNLVTKTSSETLIGICVGKCQLQGAIPNLEKLLELRDEQIAKKKPYFDIIPRSCLDMCSHAPVAISRSRYGQAAHPKLRPDTITEIIETLCNS